MDYKKAYYSLIERLKEAKEDADVCDERYCCVIDGLIQEPEESERIRKAISQCVEDMRGQFEKLYSVHHKDAIDWLEKQTNTIPNECVFRPLAGTDIKSAAGQAIKQQGVLAKEVVLAFNGAYIPVKGKAQDIIVNEYNSCLEKQVDKPQGKTALEAAKEAGLLKKEAEYPSFDEAQGTPVIKKCKEHKFEKGNWIVGNKVVCQILAIYIGGYIVDKDNCELFIPFEDEELYHLWTIEDAKKGDVLIYNGAVKYSGGIKYKRICLFNNLDNAFFTLTRIPNYVEEYNIDVNIDYPDNIVPATKEQKEILFMTIADAGYEFDFEKKELKKINQKSYGQRKECLDCQFNYAGECKGSCAMKRIVVMKANELRVGVWVIDNGKMHKSQV